MLNRSEIASLAKLEGITKENAEIYYNMMMNGDCEIIVTSKLGGI